MHKEVKCQPFILIKVTERKAVGEVEGAKKTWSDKGKQMTWKSKIASVIIEGSQPTDYHPDHLSINSCIT